MRYALLVIMLGRLVAAGEAASPTAISARGLNETLVSIAEKLTPSVVLVATEGYQPVDQLAPAGATFGLRQGSGSGVIVSDDGYIVTNAHVVAGATRIQVQFSSSAAPSGHSIVRPPGPVRTAQLIGLDAETDLALIKVDAKSLPCLHLADSDEVRQGQLVVAIGSPAGLENSVSMGVISSVARQLQSDSRVIYLQTDAPMNPGNSGGALVDLNGNLVGINTMILSQSGGSHGLGFAIPSNIVRFVVEQMRSGGFVLRGEIGVEAQTLTPGLAAALDLKRDAGVILADVMPGGPGDLAGLKIGDVVLTLNGKAMENARQFHVNVYQQRIASRLHLNILRGTENLDAAVVVLQRSNVAERFASRVNDRQHLVPRLSILALPVDEKQLRFSQFLLADLTEFSLPGLRSPRQDRRVICFRGTSFMRSTGSRYRRCTNCARLWRSSPPAKQWLEVERSGKMHYVEVRLD